MNQIRRTVLETVFDDSYGLWEVMAALMEEFPNTPEPKLRRAGAREILAMHAENWIEVRHLTSLAAPERPVDSAEATEMLSAPKYWSPPAASDDHVRIVATEHGLKEFRSIEYPTG